MKRYIRAYWYDEEESIDDFIYGRKPKTAVNENEPHDITSEDFGNDGAGYSDFDEYDFYDYSEYEDFYKQIKRRQIYVPMEIAKSIPDYNAYRKSLFGTLCLSMKTGESISDVYDEICSDFPTIVNDDVINEADMLIEIVDAVLYAQKLLMRGKS